MCGRYALHAPPDLLAEQFQATPGEDLPPRFNIAPSQPVPAVRDAGSGREWVLLRWGLVPAWAKEEKTSYSMINARAETVAVKPAYRAAFRQRRCLIPASGFYEWRAGPGGKQPYYLRLKNTEVFAFAGLWERWQGADDRIVESCTIIVTTANAAVQPIHERMPVILAPNNYAAWLAPEQTEPGPLQALLKPFPAESMRLYPVGRQVNNPRHDAADCIVPL